MPPGRRQIILIAQHFQMVFPEEELGFITGHISLVIPPEHFLVFFVSKPRIISVIGSLGVIVIRSFEAESS